MDPLVHRAIAAASAVPDLRGKQCACIIILTSTIQCLCFDNFQILYVFFQFSLCIYKKKNGPKGMEKGRFELVTLADCGTTWAHCLIFLIMLF